MSDRVDRQAESGRMEDQQFEELYEKYANDVLRVSYFYLGDRQQAEDVTQDVFVRLLTAAPALKPGSEKAWLLKVALNRCRDIWRSSWVRRVISGSPVFETIPGPDTLGQHMKKAEILAAVNGLPPEFREIFILHYYQGYGIGDVAKITGVPEGTVSSRLARGRKKLAVLLGEGES